MSLYKHFSRLRLLFNHSSFYKQCNNVIVNENRLLPASSNLTNCVQIHTTRLCNNLMEFFDDKKNWGEKEVKVGRSWKLEELRIKSNSDLHKLWYVLLKEKNMLLTMEHEYEQKCVPFPSPERIDKVNESMENLEKVVRERNRAYHFLETGEHGERPTMRETNCFGLEYTHFMMEHVMERKFNRTFNRKWKLNNYTNDHVYVRHFLRCLNEKKIHREYAKKMLKFKHVCGLFKRFPNLDEEALKAEFPDIDIEAAKKSKIARGNRANQY